MCTQHLLAAGASLGVRRGSSLLQRSPHEWLTTMSVRSSASRDRRDTVSRFYWVVIALHKALMVLCRIG